MGSGEKHSLSKEANAVGLGEDPSKFPFCWGPWEGYPILSKLSRMSHFQGQRGGVKHLKWRGLQEKGLEVQKSKVW